MEGGRCFKWGFVIGAARTRFKLHGWKAAHCQNGVLVNMKHRPHFVPLSAAVPLHTGWSVARFLRVLCVECCGCPGEGPRPHIAKLWGGCRVTVGAGRTPSPRRLESASAGQE
eukprot:3725576-Pyramimonas_sp.AAC.1